MLQSGFSGAPVSRLFLLGLVGSYILAASIADYKPLFHIQLAPHWWQWQQWHLKQALRILLWQVRDWDSTGVFHLEGKLCAQIFLI